MLLGCRRTPFLLTMKKITAVLIHPVTTLNLLLVGCLALIELIHIRAHHTLELDVHSHVHNALKKNPELARPACYKLDI
jgi:hypothetical protein